MSNSRRNVLGRGLKALLNDINTEHEKESQPLPEVSKVIRPDTVKLVKLSQIEVNPFQPRADFDGEKLEELANSIKVHGVIQPITVREMENKNYQLIAGERRVRASKMAGLAEIPAYVLAANDQETLEIALIENIQREDLNALEVAFNYKRLLEECSLTQEQLSERVGKNRTTVTNYLRLLKLPVEVQNSIRNGEISMGHARAIINIDDEQVQNHIYKEIIRKKLSVRQTEDLVKNYKEHTQKVPRSIPALPPQYKRVQDTLSNKFATKVEVKPKRGGKGEVVFTYYSESDLRRLVDKFNIPVINEY